MVWVRPGAHQTTGCTREVYTISTSGPDLALDALFVIRHALYFFVSSLVVRTDKNYDWIMWYVLWWNHCRVCQKEVGFICAKRKDRFQTHCKKVSWALKVTQSSEELGKIQTKKTPLLESIGHHRLIICHRLRCEDELSLHVDPPTNCQLLSTPLLLHAQ